MASEKARVKVWEDRVRGANKLHERWYKDYRVKNLEEYYLGKQWRGSTDDEADGRYVINLVFSTMETNKPSLIFRNPQVKMEARPGKEDDLGSTATEKAKLCQDTIQTFIDDPDIDFVNETSLALHEAHFAFGMIEVGYTADWLDNPDAGKPVLKEKDKEDDPDQPEMDDNEQPIPQPGQVVVSEHLFLKRIPAHSFRVGISNKNKISRNDWVGYYEWHYVNDLKENPLYKKGARGLKASGMVKEDYSETGKAELNPEEREARSGMVKVWKIWDLRTLKRVVIAEGHDKFLLEGQPYKFLPFSGIKFYEILDSYFPCPPVFQWLGPQDEVNETRDAQRAHRRRFYRRYSCLRNSLGPEEKEKFETGGDGVVIEVDQQGAIQPIDDAPLGADVWAHLDASKTDFMTISGVSGDQRGVAESETATQAAIIDKHAQLRESSIRAKVQSWLADIARLMLLTVRENMALDFWIKRNVDLDAIEENGGEELVRVMDLWKKIDKDELGNFDMEINVDLSSMSPVAQEAEKMEWNQVLSIFGNPALMMVLASSPVLLKKTLRLYGVTSQTEVMEIAKAMQLAVMMQMASAAAAAGGPGGPGGGKPPAGKAGPPAAGKPRETKAEMGGNRLQ